MNRYRMIRYQINGYQKNGFQMNGYWIYEVLVNCIVVMKGSGLARRPKILGG